MHSQVGSWFLCIGVFWGSLHALAQPAAAPVPRPVAGGVSAPGPNLAVGKPYTFSEAPNYDFCMDAGDATQLTDDTYVDGHFWVQKGTVGWAGRRPVIVTIDLQQVQPIAGISYDTAAGEAEVEWPAALLALVSDDGTQWTYVGDLSRVTAGVARPPAKGYAQHRFATAALKARGRFVALVIDQSPYCFCDEIEVWRGQDEWLGQMPAGSKTADLNAFFYETRAIAGIRRRLETDLAAARAALAAAALSVAEKTALSARADHLAAQVEALPDEVPPGFRTVLPLNDLHAAIYALNAPVLRARGLPPLTVWAQNRWDPLEPTQAPERTPEALPALRVEMLRREYRAEVFNVTNSTDAPVVLALNLQGLPGGANPAYVSVREVLFTDTRERIPVAAALPEASMTATGYSVTIPAGMTRQVWLSFHPVDVVAGTYTGKVVMTAGNGPAIALPLTLQLYPFDFPAQPTLALGGCDYLDGDADYYRAPGNVDALIPNLRAHFVDSPWANSGALPGGARFDAAGRLANPGELDFRHWDEWLRRWPGARRYFVFLNVGKEFAGETMGTPRFGSMVGDLMKAWVQHLRGQGLTPGQLHLLLVDEPLRAEQDEVILAWARAIRAAEPEVVIWEDPCHADPDKANQEMLAACTVLCPNTQTFMRGPQSLRDAYLAQQKAGRKLWFYMCAGPVRLLDPYAYHRGQEWWALEYGALGSVYWAFGCAGGSGNSWNTYAQRHAEFSPFFVSPDSVTDGKHWEAVREGVEDYEYFVMLRDRVAALAKDGATPASLAAARQLLEQGPRQVIAEINEARLQWREPKDRGIMDRVRVDVLRLLAELQQAQPR